MSFNNPVLLYFIIPLIGVIGLNAVKEYADISCPVKVRSIFNFYFDLLVFIATITITALFLKQFIFGIELNEAKELAGVGFLALVFIIVMMCYLTRFKLVINKEGELHYFWGILLPDAVSVFFLFIAANFVKF
jgi:hypothetical protein